MKFTLKEELDSISYWFEDDFGPADFDFELTLDDKYNLVDELLKTYSKEKLEGILENFIHEENPDYESLDIKEQTEALKEILFDHLDEFSEDAESFFHDDAYEQFKETEDYREDPYSYYGVSPRDFY